VVLGNKCVDNILHGPDFKFNLLSVSKLTKQLRCSVNFYPDFCLFQELYSGKVLGIGRESDDLYLLKGRAIMLAGTTLRGKNDSTLWHHRLGHASLKTIQHLPTLQNKINSSDIEDCDICPLAKQCRLQFPVSSSRSTNIFQLMHLDVWGPYKVPTYDRK